METLVRVHGKGDADADLTACRDRNSLPICPVATDISGNLLGTIALRTSSVGSELGLSPSLTGLLVGAAHGGSGIGTTLVAALEDEAALLRYDVICTSTDTAENLTQRRGWVAVGSASSLRGDTALFRFDLSKRTPQ